jgi:hypothetical protein
MRDETRRKLERALWRERAKKAGIGLALVAIAGIGFIFEDLDAHVEDVGVPGTVTAVGPLNTNSTKMVETGLSVDVTLDSGPHVSVMALKTTNPHVGDHVRITEHRHGSGRVTYSWK